MGRVGGLVMVDEAAAVLEAVVKSELAGGV